MVDLDERTNLGKYGVMFGNGKILRASSGVINLVRVDGCCIYLVVTSRDCQNFLLISKSEQPENYSKSIIYHKVCLYAIIS